MKFIDKSFKELHSESDNVYDVSGYPETGADLVTKIIDELNDKNAFIHTQLPDTIKMSEAQYDTLIDAEELEFMAEYSALLDQVKQSKNKLFHVRDKNNPLGTPLCVMEVRIQGGDYGRKD